MRETAQLSLPLLAPSQAQKHVTVNEALARLDGLTQLRLSSRNVISPPDDALDGTAYAVPEGAGGAWSGRAGKVAVRANGGWVFAAPKRGWRAFVADEGSLAVHDGADWTAGLLSLSPAAAGAGIEVDEFDHVIVQGGAQETAPALPANAIVLGVTGRVVSAISGTLSGWRLGVAGDGERFGRDLGLATGSWVRGLLSSPTAAYTPAPLALTPEGGEFAAGTVRLAVHYLTLRLPEI